MSDRPASHVRFGAVLGAAIVLCLNAVGYGVSYDFPFAVVAGALLAGALGTLLLFSVIE